MDVEKVAALVILLVSTTLAISTVSCSVDDVLGAYTAKVEALHYSVQAVVTESNTIFSPTGSLVTATDNGDSEHSSIWQQARTYNGVTLEGGWVRVTIVDGQCQAASCSVDGAVLVIQRAADGMLEPSLMEADAVSRSTRGILQTRDLFEGCPSSLKTLSVGIVADYGFFLSSGGSVSYVLNRVANMFTVINAIFGEQLHVEFQVEEVVVHDAPGGEVWNEAPSSPGFGDCPMSIEVKLSSFSHWRGVDGSTNIGLYHLLTDCYGGHTIAGLANMNVLCLKDSALCESDGVEVVCTVGTCTSSTPGCQSGTGITSDIGHDTWALLAHEFGHNFGALHQSSGIMASSRPSDVPPFTFISDWNRDEMCSEIMNVLSNAYHERPNCLTERSDALCGNGILERGEDCDEVSPCCSECSLVPVDPLYPVLSCSNGAHPECCSACKASPSTTTCNNGTGYCSNGACEPARCVDHQPFCGTNVNGCLVQCTESTCKTRDDVTSLGNTTWEVADGSACAYSPLKVCSNGECLPVTDTKRWSYDDWTTCSDVCGGGTQERTSVCRDILGAIWPSEDCSSRPRIDVQSCNEQPCSGTAVWATGPWSACPTCVAAPTRTRAVHCVDMGLEVSATMCGLTLKPIEAETCDVRCAVPFWRTGEWSPCSATCGEGLSLRTSWCATPSGDARTDAECGPAPVTQRLCTGVNCGEETASADELEGVSIGGQALGEDESTSTVLGGFISTAFCYLCMGTPIIILFYMKQQRQRERVHHDDGIPLVEGGSPPEYVEDDNDAVPIMGDRRSEGGAPAITSGGQVTGGGR